MNHYHTSTGERLTQDQINYRLGVMYHNADVDRLGESNLCEGCEQRPAEGHAHIIPQARCKQLRKTELIWDRNNIFNSCHSCNSIAENVSSNAITELKNYDRIKEFMTIHDPERASKLK